MFTIFTKSKSGGRFPSLMVRSPVRLTLAVLLIPLFILAGCNNSSGVYSGEPEAIPVEARYDEDEIDDEDITRAVERELMVDARTFTPEISDIEVTTTEGVVTLTGTTHNILAKDRATHIASTIKGVRSVINRVVVDPSDRTDVEIANDVLDAFSNDPATEAWEITVNVTDGHVTLNGTVDSWKEKQLAEKVAKGVDGVTALTNAVSVDDVTTRSDAEIREEVERALLWDARVNDALVHVDVEDGVVTLTGSVGSAYERTLAIEDAYVIGVPAVNVDDLEVHWWARDDMKRAEWASTRPDPAVAQAIRDAFFYDPRVSGFDITVEVEDGVATLTGVVDNLKAKQSAAEDARNTVGVRRVENNLTVEPVMFHSDEDVARNIEERLVLDPMIQEDEVNVRVDGGVAMLGGEVDTYFEKLQVGDVAARASGVRKVENHLDVTYEPLPYDPLIYSWNPVIYDVDYFPHDKQDVQIRHDVEQELWWSPYVEQEAINVSVEDGIVTLTGSVDSWTERELATQEAFEGGALGVENELTVYDGRL